MNMVTIPVERNADSELLLNCLHKWKTGSINY